MTGEVEVRGSHGPECACTRCRGFQPGHDLSLRHGAYATLRLAPRAAEIADDLRPHVPAYSLADELAVQLLARTLARIEAAEAVLETVDTRLGATEGGSYLATSTEAAGLLAQVQRLREDLRGWLNLERRLLGDLGMTTTSRAKLGLDIARTGDELARYLEGRNDGGAEGGAS